MKIFLSDVTAKFVCVSLSEELLVGDSSSIGGVRGFDTRIGEFDWESIRTALSGVRDLPLEPSGGVGLVWFRCLIGEMFEPKGRLRAILLGVRCGATYDARISYARVAADISGVYPLLKLVRLDEEGEGEVGGVADWNK